MYIYKNKFYQFTVTKEKDSFGAWRTINKTYIASGAYCKHRVAREEIETPKANLVSKKFRLLDGHIPENCPIVPLSEAIKFIMANTNQCAELID